MTNLDCLVFIGIVGVLCWILELSLIHRQGQRKLKEMDSAQIIRAMSKQKVRGK